MKKKNVTTTTDDRLIVANNTEKYVYREMKPKMNVSESEIEQECNADEYIDVGQCSSNRRETESSRYMLQQHTCVSH